MQLITQWERDIAHYSVGTRFSSLLNVYEI